MAEVNDVIGRVSAIVDPVYLVGGSVRDALMGRECADFDFCTPLDPESIEQAVRAAGRRPYLMGKRFGTIGFRLDGINVEVTTFRSETYLSGSRRPSVEFLSDLRHDLSRRDFTVNAMARHGDELIDLFGGRQDLETGLIRAVGDPVERFSEDPLRMLRAARFVSELDFSIDADTSQAAAELAVGILSVARERWMIELDRLLVGPGVKRALHLLADMNLIDFLLPEVGLQCSLASPNGAGTLFDATVEAVGSAPEDISARWAELLRFSGAPYLAGKQSRRVDAADRAHREQAALGAEIVEKTALYLKWSNRRREDVKRLVSEAESERD